MAQAKDLWANAALRTKVESNLGKPVLALFELPMNAAEQAVVKTLNLKEGDIVASLTLGGIHSHTWCCCASFPPDCDADVDG
jgi:hypothetical protein